MTDPDLTSEDIENLDPTQVFPKEPRRHDDKGRIDSALLAQAREFDEALDAVLTQARAVVAVGAPATGAIRPLVLLRTIEKLEARLNLLDAEAQKFP